MSNIRAMLAKLIYPEVFDELDESTSLNQTWDNVYHSLLIDYTELRNHRDLLVSEGKSSETYSHNYLENDNG